MVIAYFPGANSAQVEDQVTKKLEQYLFQYEEVNKAKTYSTTKDGIVVVNVELTEKVKLPDVFWSKLRHQLLVSKQLDLPEGVRGPIVNSDFGDTEAMVIALESNKASYAELKTYAQKLEDYLRTIPAASKIKRVGEQKEQIVVSSSSEKLSQYGVSLQQIVKVLQSQNSINATGSVKTEQSKTPLYTNGFYNTENDLANQIVGASQSGSTARQLKEVLMKEAGDDAEELDSDDIIAATVAARRASGNLSYFAFTATPKAKTLELFGRRPQPELPASPDNLPGAFHVYSMRQAIEEGFILDVLQNYMPYKLAFKLAHEGKEMNEAEVERNAAMKGIMGWVRLHEYNIAQRVHIVVEHFRAQVLAAASPTFQEAYITSIRVRLAERRGREFLERALAAKRGLVVEDVAEEPVIDDFGSGH